MDIETGRKYKELCTLQGKRIKELEGFLKDKIAIAKVSADNENYSVNITIKEIEQALKGGE